MSVQSPAIALGRLERSCSEAIRLGGSAPGIERAAARFAGPAFAPHRHDTYAIGMTLSGVQAFRYRRQMRHCRPGEIHVLHPDELHDGGPATEAGFGYRILYLDPALVGAASGTGTLPFVAEPVQAAGPRFHPLAAVIADTDAPIDDVAHAGIVATVADALLAMAGGPGKRREPLDLPAMARLRELLLTEPETAGMAMLEAVSGLDRWRLTRQFRAVYGTSPGRFRTLRRLYAARRMLGEGVSPAEAAAANGFADQSHLTRQFKRAYGLTPARFAAAVGSREAA